MTTHNPPRPLHLTSPNPHTLSTNSSSTPPPSALRNPKRFSLATSSPSTSASARRQSSISYFPPDSTDGLPRRGTLSRRNSLGTLKDAAAAVSRQGVVAEGGSQTRGRPGVVSLPATSASVPGTPALRERPPLTLVEKHADLLHFIAQKESKCLELRTQLAIHEAELLQLKRKWERIVNRGLERDLYPTSLPNYDTTSNNSVIMPSPAVFEGLKEGVQGVSRFLASGFSITDPQAAPTSTSHIKSFSMSASVRTPSPKSQPKPPSTRKSHLARESDSSISTYATQSTMRFSQSSMSSFGEDFVYGSPSDCDEGIREDGEESSDNAQVLMVRDTGATPTMSPNPEFHKQRSKKQRPKSQQSPPRPRTSRNVPDQLSTTEGSKAEQNVLPEGDTWTSSSSVKPTTKAHRRRSRDASMRLDLEHMDFSTLSPSVLLSPPSLRGADASPSPRSASPLLLPLDGIRKEVVAQATSKRPNSNSNGVGGLAPMSSIPGFGSLAAGAVSSPPVASWMDSMGKKLGQLQRSSTFTKSQKRASLLLADMSQSIVSALTSPSPSTPVSGANASAVCTPSASVSPKLSSSPKSLLDDDDEEDEDNTVKIGTALLVPTKTQKQTQPGASPVMSEVFLPTDTVVGSVRQQAAEDDEDEWNW